MNGLTDEKLLLLATLSCQKHRLFVVMDKGEMESKLSTTPIEFFFDCPSCPPTETCQTSRESPSP